jgi:hypothetical protein
MQRIPITTPTSTIKCEEFQKKHSSEVDFRNFMIFFAFFIFENSNIFRFLFLKIHIFFRFRKKCAIRFPRLRSGGEYLLPYLWITYRKGNCIYRFVVHNYVNHHIDWLLLAQDEARCPVSRKSHVTNASLFLRY